MDETRLAAQYLASTMVTFTLLGLDADTAAAVVDLVESEVGRVLDDATIEAAVELYNGYTQQAAQQADEALAAARLGGGES